MDKKYHIIIFIVSLIVLLVTNRMNKRKAENSLGEYDYSVGTVEVYFNRGTIGHNVGRSSITYSFTVGGIRYMNNYDMLFYKLPSSPNVNDKFIVAYNKNNPQKSLLLGEYPIKTDKDFDNFIKEGIKISF